MITSIVERSTKIKKKNYIRFTKKKRSLSHKSTQTLLRPHHSTTNTASKDRESIYHVGLKVCIRVKAKTKAINWRKCFLSTGILASWVYMLQCVCVCRPLSTPHGPPTPACTKKQFWDHVVIPSLIHRYNTKWDNFRNI